MSEAAKTRLFRALAAFFIAAGCVFAASKVGAQYITVPEQTGKSYEELSTKCRTGGRALACIPTATGSATDSTGAPPAPSIGIRCGDGICNGSETTATCPVDCPAPGASCGSAQATIVNAYPSGAEACSSGAQDDVDMIGNDGVYNWTCVGGAVTATCSALRQADGLCGAANGAATGVYPTGSNACARGGQTTIDSDGDDGTFNWQCQGLNGGGTPSCSATRAAAQNGVCGASANSSVTDQPTGASACSSGSFQDLADTATDWRWRCNGVDGGSDATCTATIGCPFFF